MKGSTHFLQNAFNLNYLFPGKMQKRATILILSICIHTFGFCQIKDTSLNCRIAKDILIKKYKKEKTGGWILLISGAAVTSVGIIVTKNNSLSGAVIEIDGVSLMLSSIPCFIASTLHKNKAVQNVKL